MMMMNSNKTIVYKICIYVYINVCMYCKYVQNACMFVCTVFMYVFQFMYIFFMYVCMYV